MTDLHTEIAVLKADQTSESSRLSRHEDTCSRRYQSLDDQVMRVHSRIDTLSYAAWGATISALLTLATVLAQVAMRASHS